MRILFSRPIRAWAAAFVLSLASPPAFSGNFFKGPAIPKVPGIIIPGVAPATLPPQLLDQSACDLPALAPSDSFSIPTTESFSGAPKEYGIVLPALRGKPNHLGRRIDEARRLWTPPKGLRETLDGDLDPTVAQVGLAAESQLAAMAALTGQGNNALSAAVSRNAWNSLRRMDAHIRSNAIDPRLPIRLSAGEAATPAAGRLSKIGVYPVAADPFHWGHLLIGLKAIAQLKLDKVIYIIAADDARKPQLTPAGIRHPMAQAVLKTFAPFFSYSPIALGKNFDGETNLLRLLALNPEQKILAYYIFGEDHYQLKDKNGNDDTIGKIEKKMAKSELDFNPAMHDIGLVIVKRLGHIEKVPTNLKKHFLPAVLAAASSTAIRQNGQLVLMPYAAYDWVRANSPGLYGIR